MCYRFYSSVLFTLFYWLGRTNEKAMKIDKRKITFTALVTCLGDYTAKVQLHKEVTATINIIIATK